VLYDDCTCDQTRKEHLSEQARPFVRFARQPAYTRPSTFRVYPGGSKGEAEKRGGVPLYLPGTVWEVVQNTRELQQTPEHEAQCRPCRPQADECHPVPHLNSREKEIQSINSRENPTHHWLIVCTTLISLTAFSVISITKLPIVCSTVISIIIISIISITKLAIVCTTLISFIIRISIISITQLTIVAINIVITTIIP
jgi:hypothetical protein